MPNTNEPSGNGAPKKGNGVKKDKPQKQIPSVPPELQTFMTQGLAAAEAEAQIEHAKWKSKKALDDIVGAATDKLTKRFCVAEVAAYHEALKNADGTPNAEAIKALAWRTAVSGLCKLVPHVPREKLAELLQHKPGDLEDP